MDAAVVPCGPLPPPQALENTGFAVYSFAVTSTLGFAMKFALALLVALLLPCVYAHADVYDPATNILTIDDITVGNTQYTKLRIRLDQIAVVKVTYTEQQISLTCNGVPFSKAKYDAIATGMSLSDVNKVLGCMPYTSKGYIDYTTSTWGNAAYNITVYFNLKDGTVMPVWGTYKTSVGFGF